MKEYKAWLLSIVSFLVLNSCGGSSGVAKPLPASSSQAGGEIEVRISGTDLKDIMKSTSQFQQQILGDGVLTSVEYERAFLAFEQCIN